jgi:hypothetical protein
MNEFLAEMYGTRETIGASSNSGDVEKLAEAQLLDEALQNEGIDINTLSGEQIVKVAHTLFGDDSALVKAAAEGDKEGPGADETQAHEEAEGEKKADGDEDEVDEDGNPKKKEAMAEKIAEADFLGRTMAHAFVNEQAQIEKDAGLKDKAVAAGNWVKETATKAGKSVADKASRSVKSYHRGAIEDIKGAVKGHKFHVGKHGGGREFDLGGLKGRAISGAVGAAKFAPHAAVAGAAGYGGKKLFEKKKAASALDVLAEQRALEILKEAGVAQQTEEEKLAEAVEQRAWELLQENGYTNE